MWKVPKKHKYFKPPQNTKELKRESVVYSVLTHKYIQGKEKVAN